MQNGTAQTNAAKAPELGEIIVTLDGGLIQNVKFPPELEGRVNIRVEDEDVEELDHDDARLKKAPDGREYFLTYWP